MKYGDYDFGKKSTLSTILFSRTLENVTAVRFIVNSGAGNFVSCAEMEFYRKPTLSAAADLFTDKTCSALKPEVTRAQIQALSDEDDSFLKQLALSIFDGNYPMGACRNLPALYDCRNFGCKVGRQLLIISLRIPLVFISRLMSGQLFLLKILRLQFLYV